MNLKIRCAQSLAAAFAAFCFCSCAAATPASRAAKYPRMVNGLTSVEREKVMAGHIAEGMSRDAVYLAWGAPERVTKGREGGAEFERWRYTELMPVHSGYRWGGFGIGYGFGYGAYSYGGARYGRVYPGFAVIDYGPDYVPVTAATVKFRSGMVVGWEERR